MSRIQEQQLENGMLLLLEENHRAPVVALCIVYRVGSKYEKVGRTGLSHLLEHMMFKSTLDYPAGEFDRRLTLAGADNNASTWLDETMYYETIAADRVELALELEAIRMRRLSLLPDELETERTVVLNELAQRDDHPGAFLYEHLIASAFRVHPYAFPTIGWRKDVEATSVDELRAYYDRFYQPDNAFLVAVGDFEAGEMRKLIEQHFGDIPPANRTPPKLPSEPLQQGEQRLVLTRAGDTDHVLVGWRVPASTHPDAFALVVAGNILGSGRTSRLYRSLIDEGKATEVNASCPAFSYAEPFLFLAGATVSQGVPPDEVEQMTVAEVTHLAEDGPQPDELARARQQARVSFIYDQDSLNAELSTIASFELASSYRRIGDYVPGIDAVTAEDVMRVANTYLRKENSTVGYYLGRKEE